MTIVETPPRTERQQLSPVGRPHRPLLWVAVVLGLATAGVAAGAFFLSRQPAESHTVLGTFTLHSGSSSMVPGAACHGTGGYDDIGSAADVTIKNESGRILAVTNLGRGVAGKDVTSCAFNWTVDVPRAEFYVMSVSHRGEVTFPYRQLVASGWVMSGELGN